jgi:hypothetical protein
MPGISSNSAAVDHQRRRADALQPFDPAAVGHRGPHLAGDTGRMAATVIVRRSGSQAHRLGSG